MRSNDFPLEWEIGASGEVAFGRAGCHNRRRAPGRGSRRLTGSIGVIVKKSSESLADQAYRKIEELILTAELAPGAWIAETAIAERVGLGRTPVREAIQRLAYHGLIEIVPGRSLRIADIDVREQLLIVELRREIELLLVRRAVRFVTDSERAALSVLAAAMQAARDRADAISFFQLDLDLKLLLLRCAKHRFASEAIRPLWSASRRFSWIYRTSDHVALFADMLGRLMRAIADGNESEALQSTIERMDYLDRFARSTLERPSEASSPQLLGMPTSAS
jgi:DNA-binding GntR family transcriptional regulator